jgi:hypothetical protein
LAVAEPGSTIYQRDLAISYERLADLAAAAKEISTAHRHIRAALSIRWHIHQRESGRADLAIELAYALYLAAAITGSADQHRQQMIDLLKPFELVDALSQRGQALLAWAREHEM